MRGEWDAETKANVERLRKLEAAKEAFVLDDFRTILDPVKYHKAMLSDAAAGPKSVRSLTGAFQAELAAYLKRRETLDHESHP